MCFPIKFAKKLFLKSSERYSQGKTDSIQYKRGLFAASGLFDIFTQPIKFYYTSHYHVLRVQMFEKCDS